MGASNNHDHGHWKVRWFFTWRLIPVFLIILSSFGLGRSQSFRNSISGFVWGANRNPVPQVPVELLNDVHQVLKRTRTDGSGRYFFSGLSAGRFTIRVLPFGTNYEEQSQDVEIISFVRPGGSTNDNVQKDIYLTIRRDVPRSGGSNVAVFAQDVPDEAKKLYENSLSNFESNRPEAAVESLLASLEIFPEYYAALDRLGREYLSKGNFVYARAVFQKMISVNDRSFTGWYGLSYAAAQLHLSDIAEQAARKAIELQPSSSDAHLMLGIAQRHSKRYIDAERSLLRSKKLADGTNPDIHWNLALLYGNNLDRFDDAADELELYLKIVPSGVKTDEIRRLIAKFRAKARGGN
jgi:hypothetical protein